MTLVSNENGPPTVGSKAGRASMDRHRFRAGDRIVVRSAEDILSKLDADGTLRGLPFMPEMLEWCGKPFRVARRVEKTCVEVAPELEVDPHRRLIDNDVVVLDGPRCSGQAHGGCNRACKIFWKEEWLRPSDSMDAPPPASKTDFEAFLPRLKAKLDEDHYFCQSTQLYAATEPFPGKHKLWMLRILLQEIRNGDRGVTEILRLLALSAWLALMRAAHGKRWLHGPHEAATPTMSLGLSAGEVVRIKTRAEMVATLNHRRRNRGMSISSKMTMYCGGQAVVLGRLDRMIDERTGVMREMKDTVTLRNVRAKGRLVSAAASSSASRSHARWRWSRRSFSWTRSRRRSTRSSSTRCCDRARPRRAGHDDDPRHARDELCPRRGEHGLLPDDGPDPRAGPTRTDLRVAPGEADADVPAHVLQAGRI